MSSFLAISTKSTLFIKPSGYRRLKGPNQVSTVLDASFSSMPRTSTCTPRTVSTRRNQARFDKRWKRVNSFKHVNSGSIMHCHCQVIQKSPVVQIYRRLSYSNNLFFSLLAKANSKAHQIPAFARATRQVWRKAPIKLRHVEPSTQRHASMSPVCQRFPQKHNWL